MLKSAKVQPQPSGDLMTRNEEVGSAVEGLRNGPEWMAKTINHPAAFG